jgi:hypothetical protein
MNQLASFAVTEMVPTSSPTLFFTTEILTSLHNHSTLTSLSVRLSHAPDNEVLEALENFLERSNTRRLELDWPDLDPVVLERFGLLADKLNCLWVRAKSEADAFDILWSVAESLEAGDIRELRKIVLLRSYAICVDVLSKACERKDSGIEALDGLICPVGPVYATCDIKEQESLSLSLLRGGS